MVQDPHVNVHVCVWGVRLEMRLCSGTRSSYSGISLMRTPLGPHMCVRNMGAAIFQGLPVQFPLGVPTRIRAVQYDMATFLELWLAAEEDGQG